MNSIKLSNVASSDLKATKIAADRLGMKYEIVQDGRGIVIYYNEAEELFKLGCNVTLEMFAIEMMKLKTNDHDNT